MEQTPAYGCGRTGILVLVDLQKVQFLLPSPSTPLRLRSSASPFFLFVFFLILFFGMSLLSENIRAFTNTSSERLRSFRSHLAARQSLPAIKAQRRPLAFVQTAATHFSVSDNSFYSLHALFYPTQPSLTNNHEVCHHTLPRRRDSRPDGQR